MHVLSADQYDPVSLEVLFSEADTMRELDQSISSRRELASRHIGRQICTLFYEPSTRTRISFEDAAVKLGAGIVSTESAGTFSSAIKGETIEDTVRVLGEYNFDAIVIRHPEVGSVQKAADVDSVPIINAGDGKGEHPTQALLDTYTIWKEKGKLSDLNLVIGGDLRFGRTVRSLIKLLNNYDGNSYTFVSQPDFSLSEDIKEDLTDRGVQFEERFQTEGSFDSADVVYWTRTQKERVKHSFYRKMINKFLSGKQNRMVIDQKCLDEMPEEAIIMHPLPRIDEIAQEVDLDPRAKYFRQAGNGLYIRMALLDRILTP